MYECMLIWYTRAYKSTSVYGHTGISIRQNRREQRRDGSDEQSAGHGIVPAQEVAEKAHTQLSDDCADEDNLFFIVEW